MKTPKLFKPQSLDRYLGINENREPNEYFRTYKCNTLMVGGTTAGKTTYLLNMIMQGIFPFNKLYLFLPQETMESGLMKKFIELSKKSDKHKNNIIVYNISEHKIPIFEYFAAERKKDEERNKGKKLKKDLFVFDDFIYATTKNEKVFVNRLLVNSSRLSADTILLVQNINDFPPSTFGNIQIFVLFYDTLASSQNETILRRTGTISTRDQMRKIFNWCDERQEEKPLPLLIVKPVAMKYRLIFNNEYISREIFED